MSALRGDPPTRPFDESTWLSAAEAVLARHPPETTVGDVEAEILRHWLIIVVHFVAQCAVREERPEIRPSDIALDAMRLIAHRGPVELKSVANLAGLKAMALVYVHERWGTGGYDPDNDAMVKALLEQANEEHHGRRPQ